MEVVGLTLSRASGISGRRKVAIALVALGPELSAQVLRHMREEDIEEISLEIATMGKIPPQVTDSVLEEVHEFVTAQKYVSEGGISYAKEILERVLGSARAIEIINKLTASLKATPFDFIRNAGPEQIITFLENEHPQTIALVLAHLRPDQSAAVLSALPPDLQSEVAIRLATMEGTTPEVIAEVEALLGKKMSAVGAQDIKATGGVKALVDVLNNVDRATEKTILERLEEENPALAEEVKNMMFVFEDVVLLDDRAVQLVLREIDFKDLALALKAASDQVKEKIFKNMSERAGAMLREDMEFLGPVRLRNVEEAQQRIVAVIRRLEEAGEIVIARGKEDEIIV